MSNWFFLATANPQAGGSQLGFMFFLIIMLVVYWVFLIRAPSWHRRKASFRHCAMRGKARRLLQFVRKPLR